MEETFRPGVDPRRAPGTGRGAAGAQGLEGARVLARLLDDAIPIPGTSWRIGIDPLLGLVPGIGDALGAILSTWILVVAARLGVPATVLARMGVNVAIDAIVGVIPFVGDLADFGVKPNARNLRLLDAWLERPAPTRRASRAVVAGIAAGTLLVVAAIAFAAWRLLAWAAGAVGG
ncbi:MAG TPA: DUF4112 domain-containing protein [Anaeromyxobacter sp.]|nr:DUF4112 domain-containing protein [Anaeromyxobacter sp.]